jgi:hypothetical protein
MSRLLDILTARAEAMGEQRARQWAAALGADNRNPATISDDGRLRLSAPDRVETLLSRPWLNWPTPERLRRRA